MPNSKLTKLSSKKVFIIIVIICMVGIIIGTGLSRWLHAQNSNTSTFCQSTGVPGQIVVGFKKEVDSLTAEKLFTDSKLAFIQTDDVNLGKDFFNKTGLKYIVTVTPKQKNYWIEKFSKSPLIVQVSCHLDPTKIIID